MTMFSMFIIDSVMWQIVGDIDDDNLYTQEDFDLIMEILTNELS